ncbi:DNA-binding transcriptional regulator [Bacterioplanes sanyensis]|uniref:DNA-binding transcriptional regulator n=1 Tax=Bacterioplanes sanyensis TaxID=1249553 RepID=A0A222FP46_9GAMM|nr:YafY family protein [Bacterioplanes sanyensis]ASP40306.1 DNA-binding transcriptional regulator [Bacterioplanes sanyensis]
MRKAERLFQLLTLFQGRRRPLTGEQISQLLEVSKRTVYRDIAALQQSGIPIEGEAGVGYVLDRHFLMAPLMFNHDELVAIRLGMSLIRASGDDALCQAAEQVLHKVAAILPDTEKDPFSRSALVVPSLNLAAEIRRHLTVLRGAIRQQQCVQLHYRDEQGQTSQRCIEPLGIMCYVRHWTLIAHCRLRQDYRAFRLDRILSMTVSDDVFDVEEQKSLPHYLESMQQQYNISWFF